MLLSIYLVLINAVSLLLMRTDKYKAKNHLFRTPEKFLFASALLGGSLGCLLGMYLYRHKIRKPLFSTGVPLILFAQVILLFFYYR